MLLNTTRRKPRKGIIYESARVHLPGIHYQYVTVHVISVIRESVWDTLLRTQHVLVYNPWKYTEYSHTVNTLYNCNER